MQQGCRADIRAIGKAKEQRDGLAGKIIRATPIAILVKQHKLTVLKIWKPHRLGRGHAVRQHKHRDQQRRKQRATNYIFQPV